MSRLSMVRNGVRLPVLLERSRGTDVKYPLSCSLNCNMLCAAVLLPCYLTLQQQVLYDGQ